MPYVNSKEMLHAAMRGGYAVGAFNVENMEMAIAAVTAAERLHIPIILQTTPSTVKYAGCAVYSAIVRALAERASVPVALHLDHGDSPALCRKALRAGYSSVMIDASRLPLDENIKTVQGVVAEAEAACIPVEAELGKVGGKEDDLVSSGNTYTDPDDALIFVSRTHVCSLAVAIGTAHGIYRGTPVLDVARLAAIRNRLFSAGYPIPLVLHGASGLTDSAVKECIANGICKVNFATELRQAYTAGIRRTLESDAEIFDPKKYGKAGIERVADQVSARISVCGCDGKA